MLQNLNHMEVWSSNRNGLKHANGQETTVLPSLCVWNKDLTFLPQDGNGPKLPVVYMVAFLFLLFHTKSTTT